MYSHHSDKLEEKAEISLCSHGSFPKSSTLPQLPYIFINAFSASVDLFLFKSVTVYNYID